MLHDNRMDEYISTCKNNGIEFLQSYDLQKIIDKTKFNINDIYNHVMNDKLSHNHDGSHIMFGWVSGFLNSCYLDFDTNSSYQMTNDIAMCYNNKLRFICCPNRHSHLTEEDLIVFSAAKEKTYIKITNRLAKLKVFL